MLLNRTSKLSLNHFRSIYTTVAVHTNCSLLNSNRVGGARHLCGFQAHPRATQVLPLHVRRYLIEESTTHFVAQACFGVA